MIKIERLSYTYPDGSAALRDISLTIPDSAFVLVTGVSGAGKSTLLRAFNGLIPHFHGGTISGRVTVDDQDTLATTPRSLAARIGFVFQDPETQFVVERVEDELCFGMENAGIPAAEMGQRIEEVLKILNIAPLRKRRVTTLSGGEAQKVALASALTLRPKHLILDEPTSQLDPEAAHDLMDALVHLNCNHRLTIILAEHRLERVLKYATHWLHVEKGEIRFGEVREMLPRVPLHPPVVELGLRLGWQPIPLTVEEARQVISEIGAAGYPVMNYGAERTKSLRDSRSDSTVIDCRELSVRYGSTVALEAVDWQVQRGEIVGLLGHNGAGKSTLLKSLVGLVKPQQGAIQIDGMANQRKKLTEIARIVGYVPQNPSVVLFQETLRAEVAFTLENHGVDGGAEQVLSRYDLARYADHYPRDLSGGERQRAALAAMLAVEPPIILLDEPTRGLDYVQKRRLTDLIRRWSAEGRTVIVATHDVEWIAGLATRCTVLEHGRIVADGETADVLLHTAGFNTQLGELFHNPALLTVEHLDHLDLSESTATASRQSASFFAASNGK
ncbi:MAG: energy-coupling factor ABC transporter ATP-binding protein [Anaerolineae bacterium]|nr:energy-coupling factor ABC transporter ATP-binding protein [Anaerolineae bacterium]